MKSRNRKRQFVANVESMEERFLLSGVPQFTVKDLGIAIGGSTKSINQLGQVAGTIQQTFMAAPLAAISGQDGSPLKPIVSVPDPFGFEFGLSPSFGLAVNNSSQVLLSGLPVTGNGVSLSLYLYSNGTLTLIPGVPAFTSQPGKPLNDSGNVVGNTNDGRAFFYDGAMHDIGTLGGPYSNATSINNLNQIVGGSSNGQAYHAFLYYDGAMHDLGSLNPGGQKGDWSVAYDVNSFAQVVGESGTSTSADSHAFLTNQGGGGMHDIGLVPGAIGACALSINDNGDVVGISYMTRADGNPQITHGFYYTIGMSPVDLNSLIPANSGFTIEYGSGINNNDQIAATGIDSTGQEHILLLTPVPSVPVAPTITWANPSDITYGTPLSTTQLNATASVPGTFTYSIPQGTVLHAGAAQTITATFTPDDTTDYTTVTATASINVLKAPLTVTANNAQVRYPFAIPPLTGTITGLVNGDTDVATYTTTAVQGSWAGYYPIVPHLTDPNYNITFVNGTLTIYWNVPPGGF